MTCTAEGQTITTVTAATKAAGGRDITAGREAANQPRRLVYGRMRVGGLTAYMETTGATNEYLHMVVILCDGPIEAIETIYIGEEELTLSGTAGTGKWAGVTCVKHLGETTQTVDTTLDSASTKWTSNHRLRGIAYLYLRFQDWDSGSNAPSPALFEGNSPDISAIVQGCNDIYDPRDASTGYSANAALCLAHYRALMGAAELDSATLEDAADACDEVTSYGPRYEVGGVVELSASVEDVTRQFLAACSGTIQVTGNEHRLLIGAQAAAPLAIEWDDILEPFEVERTTGEAETLTPNYAGEETGWKQTDAPADDEGTRALTLDLVANGEQAQQVAAEANRQQGPAERASLVLSVRHLDLIAGATVDVDLAPYLTGRFDVVASGFRFDVAPQMTVTLQRQRAGLFDLITTAPVTAKTLALSARSLSAATLSPTPGSGKTFPLSVTVTPTVPGVTIRWSTTSMPSSITAGNPYWGSITLTGAATLYVAQFRDGWTGATQSGAYS